MNVSTSWDGQPKEYISKAREAEKQQSRVSDSNAWEAWEHVIMGYRELAKLAAAPEQPTGLVLDEA